MLLDPQDGKAHLTPYAVIIAARSFSVASSASDVAICIASPPDRHATGCDGP